jgi:hypothetical protein
MLTGGIFSAGGTVARKRREIASTVLSELQAETMKGNFFTHT